jgi:hypothetical protein
MLQGGLVVVANHVISTSHFDVAQNETPSRMSELQTLSSESG